MKFFAALLVVLPLVAQQVSASPFGGFNPGAGGNNSGKKGITTSAAAKTSVAVAKTSAVAKASSAASKGGKGTVTTSSVAVASVATNAGASSSVAVASGGSVSASSAAAASATASAAANSGDPQSSLTLDPRVIATGFENNGQDVPTAGQVASQTSSNNFINFCLTVPNLPITNGQQVKTGSCNPAPMGVIAATTNMPSAKFVFPTNNAVIQSNTAFTIQMAISNLDAGFFVNADENYFAGPQFTNSAGDVQGHSHVVVELLTSVTQTTTTNPNVFAFFKGLNSPATNGILTADVTSGLPAGTYRLASINTAANHQPILVAVAQHGSLDDMVYFTVSDNGQAAGNSSSANAGAGAGAAASTSVAAAGGAAAASTSVAAAGGNAAASSTAAAATASAAAGGKNSNTNAAGGKATSIAAVASKTSAAAAATSSTAVRGATPGKSGAQAGFGGHSNSPFPAKGSNNRAQGGFGGRFKVRRNALNRM